MKKAFATEKLIPEYAGKKTPADRYDHTGADDLIRSPRWQADIPGTDYSSWPHSCWFQVQYPDGSRLATLETWVLMVCSGRRFEAWPSMKE